MTFSVKPGVDLTDVHPACVTAWPTIMQVFRRHGYTATITSGRDGKHKKGSFHYTRPMKAQDWRTWADTRGTQMSLEEKHRLADDLREDLGDDFDVVVESTHIHIEYDV